MIEKMPKVFVTNNSEDSDVNSDVEEDGDNADGSSSAPSTGLASVMAKILSTQVTNKKVPILAKAKTDKELMRMKRERKINDRRSKTKKTSLQESATRVEESENGIVTFESTKKTKTKKEVDEDDDEEEEERWNSREQQLKRKMWEEMGHVRPPFSTDEIERSRRLKRIATKGVVKLFNSVLQQQTTVKNTLDKVGKTESKREKVFSSLSKGQFLDMLNDTKTVKEEEEKMGVEIKEEPVEGEKEKIWDILRDDFMMNPSMKDWQES